MRASARPASAGSALLAGTLMQLRAGDLLVPDMDRRHTALALLGDTGSKRGGGSPSVQDFGTEAPRLLLATGLASALKRSGNDGLVLAFTSSGSAEPQWSEAIAWAQQEILPLILVCVDSSGSDVFRPAARVDTGYLNWTSFQRAAGRLKLPVLSVDGQDAVAVYRVMQESVLRARAHGGPAVLWAVLPSAKEPGRSRKNAPFALDRLEHYMRTRKISFR